MSQHVSPCCFEARHARIFCSLWTLLDAWFWWVWGILGICWLLWHVVSDKHGKHICTSNHSRGQRFNDPMFVWNICICNMQWNKFVFPSCGFEFLVWGILEFHCNSQWGKQQVVLPKHASPKSLLPCTFKCHLVASIHYGSATLCWGVSGDTEDMSPEQEAQEELERAKRMKIYYRHTLTFWK